MLRYPVPRHDNKTVLLSWSAFTLNSTPKACWKSLSDAMVYCESVPIRIRATSSGPKHMNNNTSDWQPESTHPPHCTSCNNIVAPLTPKSSGNSFPRCCWLLVGFHAHSVLKTTPVVLSAVNNKDRDGPVVFLLVCFAFETLVASVWIHTSGNNRCKTPLLAWATRAVAVGGNRVLTAKPRIRFIFPSSVTSIGSSCLTWGHENSTHPDEVVLLVMTFSNGGDAVSSSAIPNFSIIGSILAFI